MRLVFLILVVCSTACATVGPGNSSGGNLRQAAEVAFKDPETWLPLVGATVLIASGQDEKIVEEAVTGSQLFSDPQGASDDLKDTAAAAFVVSVLALPRLSAREKATELGLGAAAALSAAATVEGLKHAIGRERPLDRRGNRSMPSGHTAFASVWTHMARHNFDALELRDWQRSALNAGLYGLAAGAGWARVEAGKHHPSDVLVGYAVGSFFARFFQEAFMQGSRVSYTPVGRGGALTVTMPLE